MKANREGRLDVVGENQIHRLVDFWQARPGPNDLEAKQKYYKPYLTKEESNLAFYRLECKLTHKEIAKRLHRKEVSLRQFWRRTKTKILSEHSKTT